MRRGCAIAVMALGLVLAAAPFAFSMFDRAPKGAAMIDGFAPYMTDERIDRYAQHIADLEAGVVESETRVAAALGGGSALANASPTFVDFRETWRAIEADMSDMLATIGDSVADYDAVAALPDFELFPWFFLVPGILLAGVGALLVAAPRWWAAGRWALVALGVGLIAAPVAFGMFDRAPKGAAMIRAFEDIETRTKVETIQGYFGEIAVGQGAIRLELAPALERAGRDVADEFPSTQAVVDRWPEILGDLTPMVGAMSDNVTNYDAVRALPDFRLFPWFFVIPGLLVIAAAVLAMRTTAASAPRQGVS